MNQHQRKFLLEQIEKQYKTELGELNARKPVEPSLNNYLTAAILDGTAKMRPMADISASIRQRVRDLGKTEALVVSGDSWGSRRDATHDNCVKIPALTLFESPPAYTEVQDEYVAKLKAWEIERRDLENSINAMRIKVQVGTDKALEALADQADKLCSMSLTASSQLLSPRAPLQIEV